MLKLFLFVYLNLAVAIAIEVFLYEDLYHRGRSLRLELDRGCQSFDKVSWCYMLNHRSALIRECDDFNKLASSINTEGNCVNLYTELDCKGNHTRIAPGTPSHHDFGLLKINDEVSSIRQCMCILKIYPNSSFID